MERDADLHMAQLMPLPLTVSCFSKIQIGFTFLVPAQPGSPGQRTVKRVCVLWILPPAFTASFLHPDPPLSQLASDLLKSFLKSIAYSYQALLFFIQYGLNHYQ